ncbi:unnamed protein product [Lymnaea stagnalis]|uniref:AIG1-type G domain-containing protein n=1 Tax=Lymnaea stagnalis TaxID=6523 RepID=A0AAV2IH31_LYMST
MDKVRRYNILLVGRTGNGKSSTRNSILDRKVAEVRDSSNLVVFTLESATLQPGVEVSVLEGPGIGDTGADMAGSIESNLKLVEEGLKLCGFRVDAIVVVLKYGVRFTKQEKEGVQRIQSIFGRNCLQKSGVVLMTHGDNFEMDTEDEDDMTFEKWCGEQSGDIQQVFEDCAWRLLLFNNRAKEKSEERAQQRDRLLEIIDSIKGTYEKEDYTAAEPGRKLLVLIAQREQIEKETEKFLKGVNDNLDKLDASSELDVRDVEREETSVKSHLNELNVKDNGTGVLNSVMDIARITLFRIQTLKRKASLTPRGEPPRGEPHRGAPHRGEPPSGDEIPVAKKDKPPFGFLEFFARWFNLKTGLICVAGLGVGLLWRRYGVRKRLL